MHRVTLFRDPAAPVQIALGGAVPLIFGASVGVVLGVSASAYWVSRSSPGWARSSPLRAPGRLGRSDRGLVGGVLFALGVLIAHAIAGTHAKVSLGSFPPLLIVIDAIFGMLLGALGGRIRAWVRGRPRARRRSACVSASAVRRWLALAADRRTCHARRIANGLRTLSQALRGPERENYLQGPSEQRTSRPLGQRSS